MTFQEDHIYIEKIKKGDASAFASLVEKHKDMVFTIIVKIVKKSEDAEEIAQDVFLKVFEKLEGFRGDSRFSTWLYRIAYNAAISKTRKRRLEVEALDDFTISNYSVDEVKEELESIDAEEQQALLKEAMDSLSDDDYLIVKLFYLEESSVKDISTVTGLSQANVKVKLHRIRKKLYCSMKDSMEKVIDNIVNL
ncbi:sigma-70 family RNA polymerase sigma factor [Lentimicrobium sp. L6]|uniref:RNA polymerase sigma factor n=1 Tax=Lentimicrobium sp. L6 TaxID=2735916 RepID=UPI0015581199|nr:sigma-70 family RNA polymerase sigma factor [Lentimicrobium sp. L6]NPD86450.1 sigma-70 family RNA polymerase sigma factor [Lentimicrobium sp. L6]